MQFRTLLFILILALPVSVFAQEKYTIPKKNRVIQESSSNLNKVPVGNKLQNIDFTSITEQTYQFNKLLNQGPVVFVFLSTECPVAQRYAMRLKRMHVEYKGKGVTIVGVYPNENDSVEDVKAYLLKAEYTFPIIKDIDGSLARHFGATMTPQAHLVDTSGVLRFRGPIDDNRYVTRVKHEYLKEAISAVLAGKPVPVKETPAFGCTIHFPDLPALAEINYAEHIAPIIQKNCQSCHHDDGIAPFPLVNYEDVKMYANKIGEQTQARLMPPWRTVSGHGDFKNERRLTDNEIGLIAEWVKTAVSGPTKGDASTIQSQVAWTHGEPDVIVNTYIVYRKHPKGKHTSIKVPINTAFAKDMYIRGIDFQSENRKTVRRIVASIGSMSKSQETLLKDNRIGKNKLTDFQYNYDFRIGVWLPGLAPTTLPDKIGHLLPKGGTITLDILYQGSDHEEHDMLKVGLYLSDSPDTAHTYKATLSNYTINRKNNSNQQNADLSYQFKQDSYVCAVVPQKIVEEQDIKVVAITPLGERIKLIWIKESPLYWLDEWQDNYYYRQPVFLPAGTRLEFDVVDESIPLKSLIVCHFYYVKAAEYAVE